MCIDDMNFITKVKKGFFEFLGDTVDLDLDFSFVAVCFLSQKIYVGIFIIGDRRFFIGGIFSRIHFRNLIFLLRKMVRRSNVENVVFRIRSVWIVFVRVVETICFII